MSTDITIPIENMRLLDGHLAIIISKIECNGVVMDYMVSTINCRYTILSGTVRDDYDWTFVRGLEIIGGAMIGDLVTITIESISDWRQFHIDEFTKTLDAEHIIPARLAISNLVQTEGSTHEHTTEE